MEHAVAWKGLSPTSTAAVSWASIRVVRGPARSPRLSSTAPRTFLRRWRADELEARLSGVSYRDPRRRRILRSARMLPRRHDEVLAFCSRGAGEAEHGTTALELKTGYGLSVEAELRQARLARRLSEEAPQTCSITLLACHAVPQGMERSDWVRIVCDELIPAAAREHLIDAVDVYVEDIAFSIDDLAEVARCASDVGLPLRCHADQLGPSGAAEAAVALAARSADHLNHVSATGIAALGAARQPSPSCCPRRVVPGLVDPPRPSPARRRRCVAIVATDFKPLNLAGALDARGDRHRRARSTGSAARGAAAATVNPSAALGLAPERGTLSPGRPADLVVLDGEPSGCAVPAGPQPRWSGRSSDGERVGGR